MEMSRHYPIIPAKARADGVGASPKQMVIELYWCLFLHWLKILSSTPRSSVMERRGIEVRGTRYGVRDALHRLPTASLGGDHATAALAPTEQGSQPNWRD